MPINLKLENWPFIPRTRNLINKHAINLELKKKVTIVPWYSRDDGAGVGGR